MILKIGLFLPLQHVTDKSRQEWRPENTSPPQILNVRAPTILYRGRAVRCFLIERFGWIWAVQ